MKLCETHQIGARTKEQMVGDKACAALQECGIRLCGRSEAQDGFRFVRHHPSMNQILVTIAGRGAVYHQGQWQEVEAGAAYVTPPRSVHAYHALKQEAWTVCWVMYLVGNQAAFQLPNNEAALLHDPHWQALDHLIQGLLHEHSGLADPTAMRHWTQLIHLHIRRLTRPTDPDEDMTRLWQRVAADLAHPWTNALLAGEIHISTEHLRRRCQKRFGRSPMAQITILRMEQAAALLRASDIAVQDIASAVGYQNPYAFSTAFRRWASMSPSTYRDQHAL